MPERERGGTVSLEGPGGFEEVGRGRILTLQPRRVPGHHGGVRPGTPAQRRPRLPARPGGGAAVGRTPGRGRAGGRPALPAGPNPPRTPAMARGRPRASGGSGGARAVVRGVAGRLR